MPEVPRAARAVRAGIARVAVAARAVVEHHPLDGLAPIDQVGEGDRVRPLHGGGDGDGRVGRRRAVPDLEDVDAVAFSVLRHRMVLNFRAEAEGMGIEAILGLGGR